MATCSKCKENKEPGLFYRNRNTTSGLNNWCKLCFGAAQDKYQRSKAGKAVQARYQQTDKGKAMRVRSRAKYSALHPDRAKARNAVNNAVRGGRLNRPTVCSACSAEGKTEAHHRDYSKPLEVQHVCSPCHRKIHRERKATA